MKFCSVLAIALTFAGTLRADWRDDLTAPDPGAFPPVHPVKLEYECGWSGVKAGEVTLEFSQPSQDTCVLEAKASTTGFARALWRIDATHEAHADISTLRPLAVRQKEIYRAQTIQTDMDFDETGVQSLRQSTAEQNPARRKRYTFPGLFDLQTALLFVRSQKLETGKVYRLVVYPGTSPYLATVTVLGREQVKTKYRTYPAIKTDLKLQKITKDMKLEPHGKFKRATGWLSDDRDRLPLRLDAQIFVGSVWVDLVKVQ